MAKYFNKNLKYVRKIYKISQQKIIDDLHLKFDRSSISRWEKGNIDIPLEIALKFSDYFKINYEYFFGTDLTLKTKSEIDKLKSEYTPPKKED